MPFNNEGFPIKSEQSALMPGRYDVLEILKHFPKSDFYRFMIDGVLHKEEGGWVEYGYREKGCITGLFDAFKFVLQEHFDDITVSPELIQKIHKTLAYPVRVVGYYDENPLEPGMFRTEDNGLAYPLIPLESKSHPGFCNSGGIDALRTFVAKYNAQESALIQPPISQFEVIERAKKRYYKTDAEYKQAYQNVVDAHKTLPDDSGHISYESLRHGKSWAFRPPYRNIPELVDALCQEFNREIVSATDYDKKLEIIVSFVQELERIHPFADGNGRTSYILLQRLLMQNGFLPTILYNPNYIDGFNQSDLISEIKQGMMHTLALIKNPEERIFDYKTKSITELEKFYYRTYPGSSPGLRLLFQEYLAAQEGLDKFIDERWLQIALENITERVSEKYGHHNPPKIKKELHDAGLLQGNKIMIEHDMLISTHANPYLVAKIFSCLKEKSLINSENALAVLKHNDLDSLYKIILTLMQTNLLDNEPSKQENLESIFKYQNLSELNDTIPMITPKEMSQQLFYLLVNTDRPMRRLELIRRDSGNYTATYKKELNENKPEETKQEETKDPGFNHKPSI